MLHNVRAVVLGDMRASVEESERPLLEAACLHALKEFSGPVLIGLKSGHLSYANRSLPLGTWVKLNGTELSV